MCGSTTSMCQRTHVTEPMVKCPSKYGMYIWLCLYLCLSIYLSMIPRISRKTQKKNLLYTRKRGNNKEQPSDTKQLTALYTQNSIALAHASHSEATQKTPNNKTRNLQNRRTTQVGWLVVVAVCVVVKLPSGECGKGKWLGENGVWPMRTYNVTIDPSCFLHLPTSSSSCACFSASVSCCFLSSPLLRWMVGTSRRRGGEGEGEGWEPRTR